MNGCLSVMIVVMLAAQCLLVTGCAPEASVEHYVSPRVEGAQQRINLEQVEKAFWDTQGKDFNGWMSAFEKRVNEIYDGKEVVSIDATRHTGKLVVTGYIDKQHKDGFQPGDDKLFTIEQTGDAVKNEVPYKVSGTDGVPYHEAHHSILDNPILQMMLLSHMMGGWGGRYYTPPERVVVLHDYQSSYRATPQFGQQQATNQGFFSRFKQKPGGGLQSSRSFGSGSFSTDDSKRRSFSGSSGSSGTSAIQPASGGFSWGGRRSSSSSFGSSSSFRMRSWGGRRR